MIKGSVLVVDDEEGMLSALEVGLSRLGFDVHVASGVEACFAMLKDERYDVVLADKNMPGLQGSHEGGMEIVRHVGANLPDTVVIMMTGNATVESAIDAIKLGAFDYILKPFRVNEIAVKIERAIEFMQFVHPQNMMAVHKALKESMLGVLKGVAGEGAEFEAKLEPINQALDKCMVLQKEWEKMIMRQRETLASVAGLASRARDLKDVSPELAELLDRIVALGEARI